MKYQPCDRWLQAKCHLCLQIFAVREVEGSLCLPSLHAEPGASWILRPSHAWLLLFLLPNSSLTTQSLHNEEQEARTPQSVHVHWLHRPHCHLHVLWLNCLHLAPPWVFKNHSPLPTPCPEVESLLVRITYFIVDYLLSWICSLQDISIPHGKYFKKKKKKKIVLSQVKFDHQDKWTLLTRPHIPY